MKKASIIGMLFFGICAIHAQVPIDTLKEYFQEGQYFFNREEYVDAAYYYQKLVRVDSLNANYNFKLGQSYLNIPGKEHKAIPYFKRSIANLTPKNSYKKRSFEETSAPLHALFYLGNAYRMNNELDKALESYTKFMDSPFFYGNYNEGVVEREMKACERARIIQDSPLKFTKTRLSDAINTNFIEERPVVSADGNTLVFIRKLKFYDAVFCSRKINGTWQLAENISPQIVSDGEFYPTGLSSNGKELLLVRVEGKKHDIYLSKYDGSRWLKAEKMEEPVNTSRDEIFASFGFNNSTLYIVSNRIGGEGGYDIWMSRKTGSGNWDKPVNAGSNINTELDEHGATLCIDQRVLFFSSQAHYTMGGYDLFYAQRNGNKWSVPVNLGYPLNNTHDNLFFSPLANNCRMGYYAIPEDNNTDIYLIEIESESTLNFVNN